jgi:hypothetical protein
MSQTELDLIPSALDTPEFREAWGEWIAWRTEGRKTYSARARRMALKRMIPWGAPAAVAAIEHSIAGEFQGIYPDPAYRPPGSTAPAQKMSTWAIKERMKAIHNALEESQYTIYGDNADERNEQRITRRNELRKELHRLKNQLLGIGS